MPIFIFCCDIYYQLSETSAMIDTYTSEVFDATKSQLQMSLVVHEMKHVILYNGTINNKILLKAAETKFNKKNGKKIILFNLKSPTSRRSVLLKSSIQLKKILKNN